MEKHPLQIKSPELQTSPEVERAVEREVRKTGESVPNDPSERIDAYMGRLANIFLNSDEKKRERNLEMFRDQIYSALIIKPDDAVEQILKDEAKVALDRGHGWIEITPEMKTKPETIEQAEAVIKRQKASLDEWIDYLTSNDSSSYDTWFKYYLWTSIIKLQTLQKIEKVDEATGEKRMAAEYPKRTASTLKTFPDLFRGKIAQIYDKYNAYIKGEKTDAAAKQYFHKNFAKLYAEESLDHIVNSSVESKEQTHGEWVKYEEGNMADAQKMIASLQGKYTDWCIEGEGVAKDKINEGDIHIYYTFDKAGNPTDPRLCIRMSGNHIAEVRGISGGKSQEVEQVFMDETSEGKSVLSSKLEEFGAEADKYKKREGDMKYVTRLMKKMQNDENFTKEDLVFLYEVSSKIEGFGYQRDPRIEELRRGRNVEEDMLTIFECTKDQIARVPSEINENTKAYVGQLEPGIFQRLPETLEHVYTSFPDKKIRREVVEIGGKSKEQLISEMESAGINVSDYAKQMMDNPDFVVSKNREDINLVRLTVADLGFKTSATTDQIYERAQALGLELCPPDTGPNYRLKYKDQPLGEWFRIAMKQITGRGGDPDVFNLEREGGGLWLGNSWAEPDNEWSPDSEFVFRFRKAA